MVTKSFNVNGSKLTVSVDGDNITATVKVGGMETPLYPYQEAELTKEQMEIIAHREGEPYANGQPF